MALRSASSSMIDCLLAGMLPLPGWTSSFSTVVRSRISHHEWAMQGRTRKADIWALVLTFVCCQLDSGFTFWKDNHICSNHVDFLQPGFSENKVTVDPTTVYSVTFFF